MEGVDELMRATMAQLTGRPLSDDERALLDAERAQARAERESVRARELAIVASAPKAWRALRTAERDARVLQLVQGVRMLHDADAELVASGRVERTHVYQTACDFLASPDPKVRFLLVCGGVGTGKTLASLAAAFAEAREDAERWASAIDAWEPHDWARRPLVVERARSAEELVRAMLPSSPLTASVGAWKASQLPQLWQPWSDERAEGREAADRGVRVLVIDDLGCELDSSRFHAAFGELVEERQGGGRKTILTTNLLPREIRPRYGDRIADRLNHLGALVVARGETRRRKGAL